MQAETGGSEVGLPMVSMLAKTKSVCMGKTPVTTENVVWDGGSEVVAASLGRLRLRSSRSMMPKGGTW